MNMNTLAEQALEAAAIIMGVSFEQAKSMVKAGNTEIQEIAFKLACAAIAEEKASQ